MYFVLQKVLNIVDKIYFLKKESMNTADCFGTKRYLTWENNNNNNNNSSVPFSAIP